MRCLSKDRRRDRKGAGRDGKRRTARCDRAGGVAPFTCEAASDIPEALRLSASAQAQPVVVDAPVQYLAGGTNLLDLMKLDVMSPSHVVDLMPLASSHQSIEADASELSLGAFVTMAQAADHPVVQRDYPVLCESL